MISWKSAVIVLLLDQFTAYSGNICRQSNDYITLLILVFKAAFIDFSGPLKTAENDENTTLTYYLHIQQKKQY